MSRGGSANPARTGRTVVILGLVIVFGALGLVFADLLDVRNSGCDGAGSCSDVITFFPWLAVGLAGGAVVGAVCGIAANRFFRVAWRLLRELAKSVRLFWSPLPTEQPPISSGEPVTR